MSRCAAKEGLVQTRNRSRGSSGSIVSILYTAKLYKTYVHQRTCQYQDVPVRQVSTWNSNMSSVSLKTLYSTMCQDVGLFSVGTPGAFVDMGCRPRRQHPRRCCHILSFSFCFCFVLRFLISVPWLFNKISCLSAIPAFGFDSALLRHSPFLTAFVLIVVMNRVSN